MAEVKKAIVELYKELCTKIKEGIPAIEWLDMWHNQVNFLESEHPFPTPAVFLGFRIKSIKDMGEKAQQITMQVDVYLYYESMADTYEGSWNQDTALGYLDNLSDIYALLHGSEGESYSSMRRLGLSAVDTGSVGNLYLQPFECIVIDYAATKEYDESDFEDITIGKGGAPVEEEEPGENYFLPET